MISTILIFTKETFELDYYLLTKAISDDENIRMSRDRTAEFHNAVCSLQSRQIVRATSVRDVKKVKMLQTYGEFMMAAKSIGKDVANTYTKLEKLTLLVKRKSLFNDRALEIQELTNIIETDLKDINKRLAGLQGQRQNISHQKNRHKHLLSHSNSVVVSLQSKLGTISNEFIQTLDTRTQNLKQAKDRRDHFSESVVPSSSAPSAPFRQENTSLLLNNDHIYGQDDASASTSLLPVNRQQQMLMHDDTDQYLQSRADTMQNIESTIVELGGIFQQLAHMVKEQDEMVERIDTNIVEAEMNVEAAHHQILRYFQSVTSNRWLMIKIFAVIMFFFTFFTVFLS